MKHDRIKRNYYTNFNTNDADESINTDELRTQIDRLIDGGCARNFSQFGNKTVKDIS